jgi:hypothetical protein
MRDAQPCRIALRTVWGEVKGEVRGSRLFGFVEVYRHGDAEVEGEKDENFEIVALLLSA